MTADEMFKELGYEKKLKLSFSEEYTKKSRGNEEEYVISFLNKTITTALYFKRCGNEPLAITPEELKAINKKCEELGWI